MSKRPRLEDINERTLVKLRRGCLCALLASHKDSMPVFTSKKDIENGHGGESRISSYSPDLKDTHGENFDIVAVKQYGIQSEVIAAVLSGIEPEYDWIEEMDKQFKVGDWVEVTDSKHHHGWCKPGDRFQIDHDDHDDQPFGVIVDGDSYHLFADEITPCSPPEPQTYTIDQVKTILGHDFILDMNGTKLDSRN
jgi:hypothetical protein